MLATTDNGLRTTDLSEYRPAAQPLFLKAAQQLDLLSLVRTLDQDEKLLGRGPRLPELLGKSGSGLTGSLPQGLQGLGLPVAPVEGEHQLRAQSLT